MRPIRLFLTIYCCFSLLNLSAQWEWEGAEFSNLDVGYPLDGFLTLDHEENYDRLVQMVLQPDGKALILGYSRDAEQDKFIYLLIRIDVDGSVDTTFGVDGKVYLPIDRQDNRSNYGDYNDLVLQSDNKIVVVGRDNEDFRGDLMLLRYTNDGQLDDSFGEDGRVILVTEKQKGNFKLCIQPNDKILVVGSAGPDLMLARFGADGMIDTTFANVGYTNLDIGESDSPRKILLQKDQKIIVIGNTHSSNTREKNNFALARFLPDGKLDRSFGVDGKVITTVGSGKAASLSDGLLQTDGKIIVAGDAMGSYQPDYAMVRYNSDGSLDKTFGNKGKVTTNVSKFGDYGKALIEQSDGKIIIAGNSIEWRGHLTLIRYLPDGKLDYSFGDKGKQRPYFSIHGSNVKSMVLQNNKIVLAGDLRLESRSNEDFLLIRFLTDLNVGTIAISQNREETFVYPNPIQAITTLKYVLEKPENLTIQLVDVNGRLLKTYLQNEFQQAGSYQQQIDLPTYLSTGVCFLKLVSPNGQTAIKLFKK